MAEAATSAFGAETTVEEVVNGINLEGKVVLITGTSDGIGVDTARALLMTGATVIGAVRNVEKMQAKVPDITTAAGNDKFTIIECDLANFDSIRACAASFKEQFDRLDILICNAGVMATDGRRETANGLEFQIGVNHFGHFLLIALLTDRLLASAPSRLVILASSAHKRGKIKFDDMMWENTTYSKWEAYGQAKSANILTAREFNRRYSGAGVLAFSAHPGVIRTGLQKELSDREMDDINALVTNWKTVSQGAATSTYAAVSPDVGEAQGGGFFWDCTFVDKEWNGSGETYWEKSCAPWAMNMEDAAKLWEFSEATVGETFPAV